MTLCQNGRGRVNIFHDVLCNQLVDDVLAELALDDTDKVALGLESTSLLVFSTSELGIVVKFEEKGGFFLALFLLVHLDGAGHFFVFLISVVEFKVPVNVKIVGTRSLHHAVVPDLFWVFNGVKFFPGWEFVSIASLNSFVVSCLALFKSSLFLLFVLLFGLNFFADTFVDAFM